MRNLLAWGLCAFLFANFAHATENHENGKICSELLIPISTTGTQKSFVSDEHQLVEYLYQDTNKNLAISSPLDLMNAYQVAASLIRYGKAHRIPNPEYGGGNVNHYTVFSDGIPEAGGKKIIEQYDAIQALVDYIYAGARGDGSAKKMLTYKGPAGTGKTEFLLILGKVLENLTANNPEYVMHTYEWKNLREIPELYPILNLQSDGANGQFEHPFRCPLNHSPFVLLPEQYQNEVLKMAGDHATKLAGANASPNRKPCPQCHKIRESLLKHAMKKLNKDHLTTEEIVTTLNSYTNVVRYIPGKDGTMAKMNAEGKDVDYQGLFMAPNPFLMTTFGAGHPFSYFYNGKVLRGERGFLMTDEFYRNVPELRDTFLEITENRQVTRGGSPVISIDTVMIAASNNESIDEAKEKGGTKAQLDRSRLVPMNWPVSPRAIEQTMLWMKNPENILQRKLGRADLGTSEADVEVPLSPANLNEIFPLAETGKPLLGPDHRYAIYVSNGSGSDPVHISPHTLVFMANTVSGSRMVTNPEKALKMGNYKVIHSAAFLDVITRIKVLNKSLSITTAESKELQELSRLLEEGTQGISSRDAANTWLTQAIAEAQKPENGNCVTPQIAKRVFVRLLEDGAIQYGKDNNIRLNWIKINEAVAQHFLIPSLQQDVYTSVSAGFGAINGVYDEVFQEMLTLQNDPEAREYQAASGEYRAINMDRMNEIRAVYRETNRRELAIGEIINFQFMTGIKPGETRHEGLLGAITTYMAKRTTDLISFDDIERLGASGEGSADTRAKFIDVSRVMRKELGYCERCMRAAMSLAKQSTIGKKQVQEPHQH
jgi:predicted Ser/Thr protein kinase